MRRALALALLALLASMGMPRGSAVAPDDLFVYFDLAADVSGYVNGSTVEAWAALNFPGAPDPPGAVANVEFRWYAPNGTLMATASVDPDANGWALATYRVQDLGTWTIRSTYVGTPSLWRNRTFEVLPSAWGGTVVLPTGTMVGGNATLGIAPGTLVRCDPGVYLRVKGTLLAAGTPLNPIVITSNATAPAPGDWKAIVFHPQSGNRSLMDQVRIQYPEDGVRVIQSAPSLSNVSVGDASGDGFRFTDARVTVTEGGVARTVNGFVAFGGDVTLRNATVRDVSFGVVTAGGNLTVRGASITNTSQQGISAIGTRLDVDDVAFDLAATGLFADGARGTANRLRFSRVQDAVSANATSDLTVGNSTFAPSTARDFRVTNGARLAVVNGSFPLNGETVSISSGSELTLSYYLRIRARDHDAGDANLSGASVDVFSNQAIAFSGDTDANGTVPELLLLYRRYAPSLTETTIRIVVSLAGFAFEDNNRTFKLSASTTQTFRGSTADLDGDGEPDFSDADVDNDGIDNAGEALLGTDPRNPDTDGDGMPDGWEFDHQLNARDSGDRDVDGDGDGLSSLQEYGHGTDPRTSDTDGDGMPDGWEVVHGFNPTNGTDASGDADGDGFTNVEEFEGGTDPRDPSRFPGGPQVAVWPFALALVVAVAIIAFSLVMNRRTRRRSAEEPGPEETDKGGTDDEKPP